MCDYNRLCCINVLINLLVWYLMYIYIYMYILVSINMDLDVNTSIGMVIDVFNIYLHRCGALHHHTLILVLDVCISTLV